MISLASSALAHVNTLAAGYKNHTTHKNDKTQSITTEIIESSRSSYGGDEAAALAAYIADLNI